MLKPVDIKDISEEMLRAYDSREIKSASPSQFCSYNYYEAFTEVLKALEMKVITSGKFFHASLISWIFGYF